MNRYIALFVLGIIAALVPLSGFPIFWKGAFEIAAGLAIAAISGLLYRQSVLNETNSSENVSPHKRTYLENQE